MISYIKGKIAAIEDDMLILEAGSIGYNIRLSLSTIAQLPPAGADVKIFTYLNVREDAMNLFGFISRDDLNVFKLLIGINGIGPKVALGIQSALSSDELRFAVLSDDVKTISKAPGIGPKTAQRVVMELKDKMKLEDAFENLQGSSDAGMAAAGTAGTGDAKNEAVQALVALGYSGAEALKALKQAEINESMDAEMILKAALKKLSFL
ncbi:Holliday junction branch migration protein RuvA [Anaerobium acetethylicum]|uniref:Holliday junction branch migration complex subunit RuvA n=1 Tax=Anaerobium acetethylicum TaxID=1619234 RepID=A0A1D3TNT5_9FIRM|nr:Holliday junction branch migration protein RuvA [Anaerobium acetethylicum]SCP94997.1 holliday junction DNA helicase RuvA [Anaerobium acetethylicum]